MRLTYWYAQCQDDADCYSVRTRTRREALLEREERGLHRFGPVVKVTLEYDDAFDLLTQLSGEGHGSEEARAVLAHEGGTR